MAISVTQSSQIPLQVQQGNQTSNLEQILEQLLMLEIGGMDSSDVSKEVQRLQQLVSTLPPEQAQKLENLLKQMPTDTGSEDYVGELKGFFGKVSGFVANLMGLSPEDQKKLQDILNQMPTDTSSKNYIDDMELWSANLSALLGSRLLGMSPQELQKILSTEPTDPESSTYQDEVVKFMATLQIYMAENAPDPISSSDKAKLDELKQEIDNVNLDSPTAGFLLSKYEAEIGLVVHSAFFSS